MLFQDLKRRISKKPKFCIKKIQEAYDLAKTTHLDVKRKSGEPYIIHPIEVASIVYEVGGDEDMICAALLHDVIEDRSKQPITKNLLAKKFGKRIADIVDLLSKEKDWQTSYCRIKSNLDEMESAWNKYPEAIVIKMADRLHNIETIRGFPLKKQKEYLKQTKEHLLPLFKKTLKNSNFKLFKEAIEILVDELLSEIKTREKFFLKKDVIQNFEKEEVSQNLGIMKYEGWEGIREVYLEVLKEAIKTKQDIFAFETNIVNPNLGKDFLKGYITKRLEKKIKAYVICPLDKEDKNYQNKYNGKYTEIKLLQNLSLDANVNVVGDLVMTFSTNPPQGTLQRNKSEANTWRSIFNSLWTIKK